MEEKDLKRLKKLHNKATNANKNFWEDTAQFKLLRVLNRRPILTFIGWNLLIFLLGVWAG